MPDWQELVRQRLDALALHPAEKEEVCEELTGHLEESYESLLKEDMPEHAAFHRVFSLVTNWQDLQREIFIAKRSGHLMQKRLRQLWIPGFLTR